MIAAAVAASAALAATRPTLSGISVSNGSTPFAGDWRLLTTVSPNGDGLRDAATVRFRLNEPATVRIDALAAEQVGESSSAPRVVWSTRVRFRHAGSERLTWRPARSTEPRTYLLRLTAVDARGRRSVVGLAPPGDLQRAPVVRVQGIDAAFTQATYAPGQAAEVRVSSDASSLRLQVFAYAGGPFPRAQQDVRTSGTAVTTATRVDWRAHRNSPALLRVVRAGNWRSGLYFLRLEASDGRVGYAPFVVRPRNLGEHRIAVVLATYTWQAYNFEDDGGNGWGDTWYVSANRRTIDLSRPFLDFGLPFRFHDWDLTFLTWLDRTGKQVDVLTDADLDSVASGDELARDYDLIVFPGHEEYATAHMFDVVRRYRDLGGNLAFLAADNFFWRVDRNGTELTRVQQWRDLGSPEASLVGAQYAGSNHGAVESPFVVSPDAPAWLLAGTGLSPGSSFGRYGIEIDARAPWSPPGTQVLATIPNAVGPGRTAEMTYYETPTGAKVFDAGALDFAASVGTPPASQLLENVWARLSQP